MESHRLLTLFLSEARDLLDQVDAELLVLERTPDSRAAIDAVFRAFHSLKGMSATVALTDTASALHAGESVLESARAEGQLPASHVAALLVLVDGVRRALDAAERGDVPPPALCSAAAAIEALRVRAPEARGRSRARQRSARVVTRATAVDGARWRVDVHIADDAAIPLARSTVVLRKLHALAPVLGVAPDDETRAEDAWDRHLTVWLGDDGSAMMLDATTIAHAASSAGEIRECHVTREVRGAVGAREPGVTQTVRIPVERLDELLDVVGELVLARDRLQQHLRPTADDAGRQALDEASKLIAQLRDAILRSRMVPLAQVFDRFPRHVRDTAHALGKDIDLVLEGRELEVDRSLLDELSDPLLHLLRNAIDHGLERPAERRAAGKPERGRLVVRAIRDGAMVAVTIADDGRGVDRAKVAASARAQGVADAESLADDDHGLLHLLARPGLSTATTVTALSGRGVGVDAVQNRVQSLGGRLELATAVDTGTVITMRLPLSIAMLRTLLVRVADETYAVPLTHVHGTHLLNAIPRAGSASIVLAGERLRLVSLRTHLGLAASDDVSGHLVVIDCAGERVALQVDACLSQHEIVVKPLQRVRGSASKFSGGTILPDGLPSLILDINTLS